jgi:hypothetical protein
VVAARPTSARRRLSLMPLPDQPREHTQLVGWRAFTDRVVLRLLREEDKCSWETVATGWWEQVAELVGRESRRQAGLQMRADR